MHLVSTPQLLSEILEEVREMKSMKHEPIKAKALAEQARGRSAEMDALASNTGQTGTNKLFQEASDHYKREAEYWDKLAQNV